MNFNYKNNPILGMFDQGFKTMIHPADADMAPFLKPVIQDLWEILKMKCREEVYFLTNTFQREMETKLFLWTEGIEENPAQPKFEKFMQGSGTFISKGFTNCFYADASSQIYCSFKFINWKDQLLLRSLVFDHQLAI